MTKFIIARILKQLALILEENGFVFYYDKRFDSMKPKINNKCDYLYRDVLGHDKILSCNLSVMIKTTKSTIA